MTYVCYLWHPWWAFIRWWPWVRSPHHRAVPAWLGRTPLAQLCGISSQQLQSKSGWQDHQTVHRWQRRKRWHHQHQCIPESHPPVQKYPRSNHQCLSSHVHLWTASEGPNPYLARKVPPSPNMVSLPATEGRSIEALTHAPGSTFPCTHYLSEGPSWRIWLTLLRSHPLITPHHGPNHPLPHFYRSPTPRPTSVCPHDFTQEGCRCQHLLTSTVHSYPTYLLVHPHVFRKMCVLFVAVVLV